jgi:hypothetical protein
MASQSYARQQQPTTGVVHEKGKGNGERGWAFAGRPPLARDGRERRDRLGRAGVA